MGSDALHSTCSARAWQILGNGKTLHGRDLLERRHVPANTQVVVSIDSSKKRQKTTESNIEQHTVGETVSCVVAI